MTFTSLMRAFTQIRHFIDKTNTVLSFYKIECAHRQLWLSQVQRVTSIEMILASIFAIDCADAHQDSTRIVDLFNRGSTTSGGKSFQFFTGIDRLDIAVGEQSLIAVHECNKGCNHFELPRDLTLQRFPCFGLGKRQ